MSRLTILTKDKAQVTMESLYQDLERRIVASPPGLCPVDLTRSFIKMCLAQSCGKCVPCRVGLRQLARLFDNVLDGEANEETVENIKLTAEGIYYSADCAIGYEAAKLALKSVDGCIDDFESHIHNGFCSCNSNQPVACVKSCPAGVDIPGYIAHVHEGNYADAINLIRRDNPLPTACAMICEHPCEERCRRNLIDDSVNIRGIKKYAVDQIAADQVAVPKTNVSTGKKVAIIGGGPAGMTAAYFLSLMGHKVTVYEAKEHLGGMLMYGIPNYRFPKDRMDEDMNAILSTGNIEVKYNTNVGVDIPIEEVRNSHDAMFVAIGAQKGKKLRLDGIDANNVFSAVEMLDGIGHGIRPDYTGKTVAVIGGGNVAMDAARSALRCGAKDVRIVYRRRQEDMTALDTEIESAVMEGIELMLLQAPKSIEKDENGDCCALWVQPQMIGAYRGGRPSPVDSASKDPLRVPCDVVLIAVGQDIVSEPFEEFGMPAEWHVFKAGLDTAVEGMPGVFVGGDCATGPSTAIKAIAAGKVAAHNIDEYLGYHHTLNCGVEAPEARENNRVPTGRVNIGERPAYERKHDFEHVECPMTHEEAMQESGRCLRCDVFGCGKLQDAIDR